MTVATATKTKLRKLAGIMPPREIRDNTKVRRAWLADKVAEINAQPNRIAKIVGNGSYQEVSVSEVMQVEGRLRHRGACQFCGNSQVVDSKVLVLHGYKRPGDGYVYGCCPGMNLKPLNSEKVHTEKWLAEYVIAVETATKRLVDAEVAKTATYQAFSSSNESQAAYAAKPHTLKSWLSYTNEEKAAFTEAMKQWALTFPLCAASIAANRKFEAARQTKWEAEEGVRHFTYLLEAKIFGTKLTEEVVA